MAASATRASRDEGLPGVLRRVLGRIAAAALVAAAVLAAELVGPERWLRTLRSATWPFNDADDPALQHAELIEYLEQTGRPSRFEQVDVTAHPKISQFAGIDSAYGRNACGLVAAAAALGGEDWPPLVGQIARAAGDAYRPDAGIQPSPYVAALQDVLGADRVVALDRGSLGQLHQQLEAGRIVIVNVKVSEVTRRPSAEPPNYAHYARVLAIDAGSGEIVLENTIAGPATWTVPFEDFVAAWQWPETSASRIPDPFGAEAVTRWAVAIVPR